MYIRDKNGNYVPVPSIAGNDGREVELRTTKDYIQWRYKDLDWQDLISISDLLGPKGDPGKDAENIELRTNNGNIEWRLGDGGWQLLFTMDVYATIKIGSVVTGAPGTEASVVNTGTSSEAVLNFVIPRGDTGTPIDTHAGRHAANGNDPISPASIGAATSIHAGQHAANGTDPVTPASIGAAANTHAGQHASSGSDPISPTSIGAAANIHAGQHTLNGNDPITPASIGAATTKDVNDAVANAINELKRLINSKFGCDIDSATGNVTINGTFTADAVYGAMWNEE